MLISTSFTAFYIDTIFQDGPTHGNAETVGVETSTIYDEFTFVVKQCFLLVSKNPPFCDPLQSDKPLQPQEDTHTC